MSKLWGGKRSDDNAAKLLTVLNYLCLHQEDDMSLEVLGPALLADPAV